MVLGYVLTATVLLLFCISMTSWPDCSGNGPCRTNWEYLRYSSSPNEIGDTLAGFAGSLAFVWLVVTVLLQSKELREQRVEFEAMADAQRAQACIFKKEQLQREGETAARQMDGYSELLLQELAQGNLRGVIWKVSKTGRAPHSPGNLSPFVASQFNEIHKPRLVFGTLAAQTKSVENQMIGNKDKVQVVEKSRRKSDVEDVCKLLKNILALKERLPEDRKLQLEIWKVETSYASISALLEADIWERET